jgi:hypothetical protein
MSAVLVLPFDQVRSYVVVARAHEIGLAYYHLHPELRTLLARHYEVHDADLAAARLLLAHPDMNAIGPNDRR